MCWQARAKLPSQAGAARSAEVAATYGCASFSAKILLLRTGGALAVECSAAYIPTAKAGGFTPRLVRTDLPLTHQTAASAEPLFDALIFNLISIKLPE